MVPLIFVGSAVAVVAILMLIMMRVRWNDGSRPGWEPDVAPPQRKSLPRAFGTLTVIGYLVLVPGVVLAAVLRAPALGIVCVVLYAATWVIRHILVRWPDANTSVRKVLVVAVPLGLVAAIALVMITSSPRWILAGLVVFLVPTFVISLWDRNRHHRSESRG